MDRKPVSGRLLPVLLFLASVAHVYGQTGEALGRPETAIDFSVAGYRGGEAAPPAVPAMLLIRPTGGDDTRLLQAAIDFVGKLPVQKNGFRGALLLAEGIYHVGGQLVLSKSGVVVRGRGEQGQAVVRAEGTGRRALVQMGIVDSVPALQPVPVNGFVPAGAKTFRVERSATFRPGDRIAITRPCTAAWISSLGMNKDEGTFADNRGLRWPVGSRVLRWDRQITAIDNRSGAITVDAPITTQLEPQYGGGTVRRLNTSELVSRIGLENLVLESAFNNHHPADEEHAWTGVQINAVEDAWVRSVVARHFVGSAVRVGPGARRVSVVGCRSEQPVSEIAGYRRHSFLVEGQQVLVENCLADSACNAFAVGFCAAGPNVFLDCKATHALGASGSFESWAAGVLYDGVTIEGAALRLVYDNERSQAGGWTAAHSVIWNGSATSREAFGPQGYPNVVVTHSGSLYRQQHLERFGRLPVALADSNNLKIPTPLPSLRELTVADLPAQPMPPPPVEKPLSLVNGRFVIGGKTLWAGATGDNFWRGQAFPAGELNSGICLTRWVPGRTGPGLTEDLPLLAKKMVEQGNLFYQGLTGLWYDRRRDDHSIFQRGDAHVWAPFLEMPWARSRKGKAWDGMSLYDLETFNPWYFDRLKQFARLCDENGLVFLYSLYDTHNLLEYLTHWVDYPFRGVNNTNQTGLDEPVPAEPWARFHGANQVYNAADPVLAKLHRAYIFQVLDELGSFRNVLFNLAGEFSGPLSFQRFFLQTVADWQAQHHRRVRLVLNTSKDITDTILADPALASMVDVIDTRYWQYRAAGTFSTGDTVWAPAGGQNRSFREMVGEAFILQSGIPFPTTQEQMYRQVREYTDRYPNKAVLSVSNDVSPIPSLMAGGALVLMGQPKNNRPGQTTLHAFVQQYLAGDLMRLRPVDNLLANPEKNWCMRDVDNTTLLVYSLSGAAIRFNGNLSGAGYEGVWYDPLSETVLPFNGTVVPGNGTVVPKPSPLSWLLLLQKKKP